MWPPTTEDDIVNYWSGWGLPDRLVARLPPVGVDRRETAMRHTMCRRMNMPLGSALGIGLLIGVGIGIALDNIIAGIGVGIAMVIALRWERGSGGE
jgi:hypothetical protein